MADLVMDVRVDGFSDPVGQLRRDDYGSLAFTYSKTHLAQQSAFPVSLSLPLTDEPFGDAKTRPFFDNLLQERDSMLLRVMARENLARDDIAGLLLHLGKDCSGALSVLPEGAPPAKVPGNYETDYLVITPEHLSDIVTALHLRQPMPADVADPSPLAGVQSKIALTCLPDGRFAEPRPGSGAPTTHILKVPGHHHLQDARHEHLAMTLCSSTGLTVASTGVLQIGEVQALLVTRFDRSLDEQGRVIRLHQEDFAQALGLPASFKYERNGEAGRCFNVAAIRTVLDQTRSPVAEKRRFIEKTLVNMMLGNVDAHAKNHALLYQPNGHVDVAPVYDVFPTALDPAQTDEFAFRIGQATTLQTLTRDDFDQLLAGLGLQNAKARQRLAVETIQTLTTGMAQKLEHLQSADTRRLADMVAANIVTILDVFALEIPETLQQRDAFVPRGGGWLLGS